MQYDVLRNVREGMKVVDSAHKQIGKVDYVRFGEDDPSTPEIEANSIEGVDDERHNGILGDLAVAFRNDELPEEMRERLLMQGFVRLDADGLFASDRYVLADQIDGISDDELVLKVSKDELLKRH